MALSGTHREIEDPAAGFLSSDGGPPGPRCKGYRRAVERSRQRPEPRRFGGAVVECGCIGDTHGTGDDRGDGVVLQQLLEHIHIVGEERKV